MAKPWEFFENMNAFVYVVDMDTDEMVYMNAKARKTYGVPTEADYVGRKCYELLQNGSSPCAICTNHLLRPGQFYEWEYYNPLIDRTLSLKDTLIEDDGRRLRMELAIDISQHIFQSRSDSEYRNLEAISNEGIRLSLRAPDPEKGLDIMLEYLGRALRGDRTYIIEHNAQGNDDNTYEWTAAGVTPEKENLQNIPGEVCSSWYRSFHINENIFIRDVEAIRADEPEIYEVLKPQDIHSIVVVPLYEGDTLIGFYGVDNPPTELMNYANDLLQIVAHFIVSSLRRRNLLRQLRDMSYHDQLTHFGNRYAMNRAASGLRPEESIGVVYCDINGLKRVNDTQGHTAGDRLILDACSCLTRVFGDYPLFRIGGDELLVLCAGISKDALEERMIRLKADMEQHGVVMATGVVWHEKTATDIDSLLRESEERMYQEKAAYYHAAGHDRRQ